MTRQRQVVTDLKQLGAVLQAANNILIFTHYNPDPDAYGSSCGLASALKAWGKNAQVVNETGIIERYSFIPGVNDVRTTVPEYPTDLCICCDCGDEKRCGESLLPHLRAAPAVINIDHHHLNDNFGDYNVVREQASSTSEIIYELLETLNITVSRETAGALYAGLCSDSGSFRYASTSAETFAVALKLVQKGASPNEIALQLYSRNSLPAVRLHAEALTRLELHCGGRIGECVVTEEMFKRCAARSEDTDDLVEKIRDIEGVLIAALVRFDKDLWRVSLRSKSSQLDVSIVARHFNGGGHKAAAAFRSKKNLAELRQEMLRQFEKLLAGTPD